MIVSMYKYKFTCSYVRVLNNRQFGSINAVWCFASGELDDLVLYWSCLQRKEAYMVWGSWTASLDIFQIKASTVYVLLASVLLKFCLDLQWNPSKTDAIGTKNFVRYKGVSFTEGLFKPMEIRSGQSQVSIFNIVGVRRWGMSVKKGSTVLLFFSGYYSLSILAYKKMYNYNRSNN